MADITARLPGDRAKILGLQSTVINMAYAAGPAIGGVCCDLYGVRTCFYIVGGAAILTSVGYSLLCVWTPLPLPLPPSTPLPPRSRVLGDALVCV